MSFHKEVTEGLDAFYKMRQSLKSDPYEDYYKWKMDNDPDYKAAGEAADRMRAEGQTPPPGSPTRRTMWDRMTGNYGAINTTGAVTPQGPPSVTSPDLQKPSRQTLKTGGKVKSYQRGGRISDAEIERRRREAEAGGYPPPLSAEDEPPMPSFPGPDTNDAYLSTGNAPYPETSPEADDTGYGARVTPAMQRENDRRIMELNIPRTEDQPISESEQQAIITKGPPPRKVSPYRAWIEGEGGVDEDAKAAREKSEEWNRRMQDRKRGRRDANIAAGKEKEKIFTPMTPTERVESTDRLRQAEAAASTTAPPDIVYPDKNEPPPAPPPPPPPAATKPTENLPYKVDEQGRPVPPPPPPAAAAQIAKEVVPTPPPTAGPDSSQVVPPYRQPYTGLRNEPAPPAQQPYKPPGAPAAPPPPPAAAAPAAPAPAPPAAAQNLPPPPYTPDRPPQMGEVRDGPQGGKFVWNGDQFRLIPPGALTGQGAPTAPAPAAPAPPPPPGAPPGVPTPGQPGYVPTQNVMPQRGLPPYQVDPRTGVPVPRTGPAAPTVPGAPPAPPPAPPGGGTQTAQGGGGGGGGGGGTATGGGPAPGGAQTAAAPPPPGGGRTEVADRRTEAFDPSIDRIDPQTGRTMPRQLDAQGRPIVQGPPPQMVQQAQAQVDRVLDGATHFANFTTRAGSDHPHANRDQYALYSGVGAMPAQVAQGVYQAWGANGKLTPAAAMTRYMVYRYEALSAMGKTAQANQMAFEVVQRLNLETARWGDQAYNLARQGDQAGAAQALIKAHNFTPDGRSLALSKDGKSFIVLNEMTGQPVSRPFPATPQFILAASLGLRDGTMFWNHLAQRAQMHVQAQKGQDKDAEGRAIRNDYNRLKLEQLRRKMAGGGGKGGGGTATDADIAEFNRLTLGNRGGDGGGGGTTNYYVNQGGGDNDGGLMTGQREED